MPGQSDLAQPSRPRILYVVAVDWFFLSHRLPIARAALERGWEVWVAAGDTGRGDEIEQNGFAFVPLPLERQSMNPFREALSLAWLTRFYRRVKPSLIHHVAVKPVLYGSLAAYAVPSARVVNAFTGLRFLFSENRRAQGVRTALWPLLRAALSRPRSRTIFQNSDDAGLLVRQRLVPEDRVVLIRGSGVDTEHFRLTREQGDPPLVVLPARMLAAKGVYEFVAAARQVQEAGVSCRFALVGGTDRQNPTAVPLKQLMEWSREGVVEWWDHREDMRAVYEAAHIVCLPSHREGLPKVLLEAAASGRPIVATDVPGCREAVTHGENGLLVPPRDPGALAAAILDLLQAPDRRVEMGRRGRERAVEEFSEHIVVRATLDLYTELVPSA